MKMDLVLLSCWPTICSVVLVCVYSRDDSSELIKINVSNKVFGNYYIFFGVDFI